MALPAPTCNPWDLTRTPGGSSSGSAAAVADDMLPIATGSQVRGSVIRPASICGVIGLKPTFGALNRHGGVDPNPSLNHLGLLGGTLTDIWETAHGVASASPDPGYRPFAGPAKVAAGARAGTARAAIHVRLDENRRAVAGRVRQLTAIGCAHTASKSSSPMRAAELDAYEAATRRRRNFSSTSSWEMRWPLRPMSEMRPDAVSAAVRGYIERAGQLTVGDYGSALDATRSVRAQHRALAGRVDAFITLAHIGPGQ